MKRQCVIGLGFGDEGKGLVTDYLCSKSEKPIVIRFSGGQQAGHAVVIGNKRHVFSSFGSGSLRGVPTYWSRFCTISPVHIMNEYLELAKINIHPKLYIDEGCPVTTPFEIRSNHNDKKYKDNGTCGRGIGATWEREEKFYSLKAIDLKYDSVFSEKISMLIDYYKANDTEIPCGELAGFFDAVEFIYQNDDIQIISFFDYWIDGVCGSFTDEIYEGSQGLMLDQNIGFFPYVTRGHTDLTNIKKLNLDIFFVTRAYQTRHGNGPMTNLRFPHNIKYNENETNIYNPWQGELRRTLLDVDLLEYALRRCSDGYNRHNLVITCLDHIEEEYRFTRGDKIINCNNENDFINKIADELGFRKIYISRSPESKNIEQF